MSQEYTGLSGPGRDWWPGDAEWPAAARAAADAGGGGDDDEWPDDLWPENDAPTGRTAATSGRWPGPGGPGGRWPGPGGPGGRWPGPGGPPHPGRLRLSLVVAVALLAAAAGVGLVLAIHAFLASPHARAGASAFGPPPPGGPAVTASLAGPGRSQGAATGRGPSCSWPAKCRR